MVCHLPFLLPVAGLALFAILPFPMALGLYVPLTVLSIAIALPAIRALAQPIPLGGPTPRPREGLVVSSERRAAVVRWGDELWNAVADEPLALGDRVVIVELRGLTALVHRADAAELPRPKGTSA